jgi:hypothetical protein
MVRRFWFVTLILSLMVVFSACGGTQQVSSKTTPTAVIQTPNAVEQTVEARALVTVTSENYQPFQPLQAKVVKGGPVYVTGDKSVPTAALNAANNILKVMLKHRPDIVDALIKQGTFTAVASRNEHICDLPYFSQSDSSSCQKYGDGGAGGTLNHPITACDEKNLVAEPDDPYQRGRGPYGQDICVHELAHTIMNVGLSQADRDRIYQGFLAAKQSGHWGTDDYAMSNEEEFWAVMSQFYFSAGPSEPYSPSFSRVANGASGLKQYDPAIFELVDSIYQGSANLS